MAGFITLKNEDTYEFHIYEIRVGANFFYTQEGRRGGLIKEIDSIQLDGDELDSVIRNFENIPFHREKRVQIWRGDIAKFIVENWK